MCPAPSRLLSALGVAELGEAERSLPYAFTLGLWLALPISLGVGRVEVLSGGFCPEWGQAESPDQSQLHL